MASLRTRVSPPSFNMVQERNAEAVAIAAEAQELHGMFRDLAVLVQEQSKQLDVVETQVDAAHTAVKAGNSELREASKLQGALTKKVVCFSVLIRAWGGGGLFCAWAQDRAFAIAATPVTVIVVAIIAVPVIITQAPHW